jgi:competence protein ComEA
MTLTGIGKTLADRILAYKEEDGGFEYLEEIMNVDGIGKSIFNKIKDKICL